MNRSPDRLDVTQGAVRQSRCRLLALHQVPPSEDACAGHVQLGRNQTARAPSLSVMATVGPRVYKQDLLWGIVGAPKAEHLNSEDCAPFYPS